METEEASNGDLMDSFKENEEDGGKKSPEGREESKIKGPEEGTNGSCFTFTTGMYLYRIQKCLWFDKHNSCVFGGL